MRLAGFILADNIIQVDIDYTRFIEKFCKIITMIFYFAIYFCTPSPGKMNLLALA